MDFTIEKSSQTEEAPKGAESAEVAVETTILLVNKALEHFRNSSFHIELDPHPFQNDIELSPKKVQDALELLVNPGLSDLVDRGCGPTNSYDMTENEGVGVRIITAHMHNLPVKIQYDAVPPYQVDKRGTINIIFNPASTSEHTDGKKAQDFYIRINFAGIPGIENNTFVEPKIVSIEANEITTDYSGKPTGKATVILKPTEQQ